MNNHKLMPCKRLHVSGVTGTARHGPGMATMVLIVAAAALLPAVCFPGATQVAQALPVAADAERLVLVPADRGAALVIARRTQVPLVPPVRGSKSVEQWVLELMGPEPGKERLTGPGMFFTSWGLVWSGGNHALLVGADISGVNPLDWPDNPLASLRLLPVSFAPPEAEAAKPTNSELRQAFWRLRSKAVSARISLPGRVFQWVDQIAVCRWPKGRYVCVGLTKPREGTLERGLWAREFTTQPLNWVRGGGWQEGSFRQVAAACLPGELRIAVVGEDGGVLTLSARSVASLSQATLRPAEAPGSGDGKAQAHQIALASAGERAVLAIVPEDANVLWLYRDEPATDRWQFSKQLPLTGKPVSISLLLSGGDLHYAYLIRASGGGSQARLGTTRWP